MAVTAAQKHLQAVSAGLSSNDDGQDATLADQLMGKMIDRIMLGLFFGSLTITLLTFSVMTYAEFCMFEFAYSCQMKGCPCVKKEKSKLELDYVPKYYAQFEICHRSALSIWIRKVSLCVLCWV